MVHAAYDTPQNEKRREWEPKESLTPGQTKHIKFISNATLYNQIIEITNSRRRSISDTVRLLLYIGIEQYNLNHTAGITTGKKRQQESAVKAAQAQAKAAQRKRKGKQDTAQALTPLLYGIDDETP